MNANAERFASEAQRLEGVAFRLHGRTPSHGLDCVGLVTCALEQAGLRATSPLGYSIRNLEIQQYLDAASRCGLVCAAGPVMRGDVLLVRPGPSQHHLLVALGENRFVHAHAGLRRVVTQTGLPDWQVLHHWRLAQP